MGCYPGHIPARPSIFFIVQDFTSRIKLFGEFLRVPVEDGLTSHIIICIWIGFVIVVVDGDMWRKVLVGFLTPIERYF
jgi:hypothetical protein